MRTDCLPIIRSKCRASVFHGLLFVFVLFERHLRSHLYFNRQAMVVDFNSAGLELNYFAQLSLKLAPIVLLRA